MTEITRGMRLAALAICEIQRIGHTQGKDIGILDAMLIHIKVSRDSSSMLPGMLDSRSMFVDEAERIVASGVVMPAETREEYAQRKTDMMEEEALIKWMNGDRSGDAPTVRKPIAPTESVYDSIARLLKEAVGDEYGVEVVDVGPEELDKRILKVKNSHEAKKVNPGCKDVRILMAIAQSADGEQVGPGAWRVTGHKHRATFREMSPNVVQCEFECRG